MKNCYLTNALPTRNTDSYARYFLFIYEIFNDAARYSDIIASNGKMIREKWVEMVMYGNVIA
jgi:hypothetical protein